MDLDRNRWLMTFKETLELYRVIQEKEIWKKLKKLYAKNGKYL